MESNDLKIFQAAAYEKSISKAAEKLGYVQSNVTLRIKILEKELGTTLFLRNNKGITLSEDGEKLLVYADEILRLMEEAEAVFKQEDSLKTLKIGATQTIAASLVPKLLRRFADTYPQVLVSLKTDNHSDLMEEILKGELEGAFTNVLYENNNLRCAASFTEDLAIISALDITEQEELLRLPIIINSNTECPYRVLLEKWMITKKGNPKKKIEFDSLEGIIKCVEEGMGISLLPTNLIIENNKLIKHVLPPAFNKLTIYFMVQKDVTSNSPVNLFLNMP